MAEQLTPDLCVIGAGSGGLSVAAAAAQFGVDVVLIERDKMGGDCLNYGCVPSKSLIAAARRAHTMRASGPFGIKPLEPAVEFDRVHDHIHEVIAAIEPNDSVERFTGLGVNVIKGEARFRDKETVIADGREIKARRFVIATGSSPALPPIPGIERVPYFTNETIFDNKQRIEKLIVVGGGPIGMELAHAFRRLGTEVAVLEAFTPLAKEDPELAEVVLRQMESEGVEIISDARVERFEPFGDRVQVLFARGGQSYSIDGSHLLLATGRRPNIEKLNLDNAAVRHDRTGIKVDKGLRTSNRRVYAIGDVTGGLQFTHVANYHASVVIKNALFRLPAKVNEEILPRVTFTDPELAQVGLTEEEARKKYRKVHVYRWPYSDNDRAQAERATDGFLKVITTRRGRVIGASMVGEQAGELIQMWSLAMHKNMKIGALASIVSPYPTLAEINKRAAINFYTPSLTNPMIRRVIGLLRKLG
ncbi:dihydrolipoyl dehydrogenase family protein [Dichotomicrobium thermohalophilum]|uniref:Pyruvate/2-oxoglutarate dehydrogenase complex dihydrolipoamide dehydrogenase (E3) component n=1 Tax=Dichotomicrobium thermohalophilum TaxID=933063 RepID=A0A397PDX4_9HYPH|nr:FAD-dependent oxidoreductase [Dichotomicrobium thermohalophilum]RIA47700.1 pyruvate/2-oxoglutarate dehydrogenase complex dihydrolipoamide dehydrogenase (E3) component [Dichotomicrobium thermohalophilum]